MGTEKRERQKANRAKKQAEEAKAARTSAVKRNVVRWVLIAVAAVGAVILIAWIGGAFSSDDPDPTIPITLPEPIISTSVPGSTVPGSTVPGTTAPATTVAP